MTENDPFPEKKPGKRLADVIIAVLGARTHAAAAKQLGISVATLRR
jgi:hypothetical protein